MEVALAWVLPLVGGALFTRDSAALKYRIAREDGHRLYFRIAYHGAILFCIALLLAASFYALFASRFWFSAVEQWVIDSARPLLKSPEHAGVQVGFVLICFLTIPLGRLGPALVNRWFTSSSEKELWVAAETNELELLLMEAVAEARAISITLSSGKVYVGYPLGTPEPRIDRKLIALLPLMSGFRDGEGRLTFTTFYDELDEELAEAEDFRLVLPIDKMASISFFDVAVYERFQAKAALSSEDLDESAPLNSPQPATH